MNSKFNNIIWKLIYTLPILYIIMPIISRIISTYFTTYTYMFIVLLIMVGIVLGKGVISLNRFCGGILMPFILFNLLTFLTRSESLILWGYSILLNILPIVLGYFIIYYRKRDVSYYQNVILIALAITGVTTCIGLIRNPFAARILATIESSNDVNAVLYTWQNIGGYEFIYMVVLLYPLLILAYKRKKIGLIPTVISVIAVFVMVILSEYTTAFLLLLITSLLFLAKRDLTTKDILFFLAFSVVCMIFLENVLSNFLHWVGGVTGSETMLERLDSLAGGKAGLEQSESNRIFLYERSLKTFFSNPLFGTMLKGGGGVGGHSFILDAIGVYGFLGIVLLVFMYRKIYRLFFAPFRNKDGYGYVLWLFLQAIVLSCVNTGMWLSVLVLLAPIILCRIYEEDRV
ncbi:MAG: hypothetical protein Q4B39_02475 [[Ruminococcus] gnavus]|nr:hypothetical protein [Mediterraneibacter gnavus]